VSVALRRYEESLRSIEQTDEALSDKKF